MWRRNEVKRKKEIRPWLFGRLVKEERGSEELSEKREMRERKEKLGKAAKRLFSNEN